MDSKDEMPYCIWHPQVASEEIYRQLAWEYPSMRYQVGRACAVAGYTDLYKELDLLPDTHIAEEARECGSSAIFDDIMSKPVKYSVMNDYERITNVTDPQPAHLNGDTAVCSSLDIKQAFGYADVPEIVDGEEWYGLFHSDGYDESVFNITEDQNIDEYKEKEEEAHRIYRDITRSDILLELLTEPLPADLPTINKDLLISMAAHNGDIDRYARLRRPKISYNEMHSCVRGIYHNTMFAVWWSKQELSNEPYSGPLSKAICARFIMNNVLSKVKPQAFSTQLPYLIWYPTIARRSTYKKLAQMAPEAIPQVLRACIVADYQDLFNELVSKVQPDEALLREATESPNPHYQEVLATLVEAVGTKELLTLEKWKLDVHRYLQSSSPWLYKTAMMCAPAGWESLYNGQNSDSSRLDLLACLPKAWRIGEEDEDDEKRMDYVEWPLEDI